MAFNELEAFANGEILGAEKLNELTENIQYNYNQIEDIKRVVSASSSVIDILTIPYETATYVASECSFGTQYKNLVKKYVTSAGRTSMVGCFIFCEMQYNYFRAFRLVDFTFDTRYELDDSNTPMLTFISGERMLTIFGYSTIQVRTSNSFSPNYPTNSSSKTLESVMLFGEVYKLQASGGGTSVEVNVSTTTSAVAFKTIKVGDTIYDVEKTISEAIGNAIGGSY